MIALFDSPWVSRRLWANLNQALALAEIWAAAYRDAGPTIRRQMNQAIFKNFYVDHEGGVTSEFSEPFEPLVTTPRCSTPIPTSSSESWKFSTRSGARNGGCSVQGSETNKPRRFRDGVRNTTFWWPLRDAIRTRNLRAKGDRRSPVHPGLVANEVIGPIPDISSNHRGISIVGDHHPTIC